MLVEAEDVLESCQNTLDDLWQAEYPQQRMDHLLHTAGNQIARYVQVCISRYKEPNSKKFKVKRFRTL